MFDVKELFKLSDKFLDQFRGRQPEWGPLGYVTFKRTYARVLDDEEGLERTEEYWETVRRVVEGCENRQRGQVAIERLPVVARLVEQHPLVHQRG